MSDSCLYLVLSVHSVIVGQCECYTVFAPVYLYPCLLSRNLKTQFKCLKALSPTVGVTGRALTIFAVLAGTYGILEALCIHFRGSGVTFSLP